MKRDELLDTGLRVGEAIDRAREWWNNTGRAQMLQQSLHQRNRMGRAFASADPTSTDFLPSGIVHGAAWDDLTQQEQMRIVKAWHHSHVREPLQREILSSSKVII